MAGTPSAETPSGDTPSTGPGALPGQPSTIVDIATPSVIVEPVELALVEGSTAHYTVKLNSRPSAPVVVTGVVDGEVSIDPHELRFLPSTWAAAQTVAVTAAHDDDMLADLPAPLSHSVRGGNYQDISAPAIQVTVVEDDTPTVWAAVAAAQESTPRVTFALRLSVAGDRAVTVAFETGVAGDTADDGSDYQGRDGVLEFPSGVVVQEFEVPLLDDTLDEEDEHFRLTLANPAHAALAGGGDTLAVLAIIKDDDPPPVLSITNASADEDAGTITFPVRLDLPSERTVTVQYATAPGTAGQNQFTAASGTLTFPPGTVAGSIPVTIVDDSIDQNDQSFSVTLTAPKNATLAAKTTATGTIRDNDDRPASLTYGGRGDQVFILNSDWARLGDKIYTLNLGSASAEVHLIATNATNRDQRPQVTMLSQSEVGGLYRDPPPRPALSTLPAIPTLPDEFIEIEPRPLRGAGPDTHPTRRPSPAWGVDGDLLTPTAASDREVAGRLPVTARSVVTDGSITATVLVSDDDWGAGCRGAGPCVTQEMADALADRFLRPGAGNDIYDWSTAVFGVPWGAHDVTGLIPAQAAEHVHILLYDIDFDGAPAPGQCRTVGAYDPANVKLNEEPGDTSAERLLLFLDSPMFATPDGDTWEVTDARPSLMLGTLAHEFQHMIHHYQRDVLRQLPVATWLTEMASEVAMDLLAERVMSDGPRAVAHDDPTAGAPGIEYGRLPYYNLYNDISVTQWDGHIVNYAVVYAFGAYLARTYGAELFQQIVQSDLRNTNRVIENALSGLGHDVSTGDLLADWAVATLLSDNTGAPAPYRYNTGAWASSQVGGRTFRLGSINLYNYRYRSPVGQNCARLHLAPRPAREGPYLHSLNTFHEQAMPRHSNRYAMLGRHTGTLQLQVSTPADTRLTLVVKE